MYRAIGAISAVLISVIGALWFMIENRSNDLEQLNRFTAAGNSDAPRMIDSVTRLESVSVEFPAVVFYYTILLPEDEIDIEEVEKSNVQWFKSQACSNQQVVQKVLEPGYKIVQSYQDVSKRHILRLSLGNDICTDNT